VEEDRLLIARFKAGEEEAFDRLMALHLDKVYGAAWSVLLDREEALDAAQEVFVRLHSALPRLPEDSNLPAWLYRVCLNYCIDQKRRARRVEQTVTDEELDRLVGPDSFEPEGFAERMELGGMIRSAVESLPPRQRAAFVLRHYDLLSIKEIATSMECSTGAIKAHLSRAAATLRDRLKDYVAPGK
jgi:RNA polymerase sigma-70 factor, ECF subfamily